MTFGLLDTWTFRHLIFSTFDLLDIWSFGHLIFWTFGLFDIWSLSILPTEGKLHTANYNWQPTTGKILMGKTLAGITRCTKYFMGNATGRSRVKKAKCPKDQMFKRSNVWKIKCPKDQMSKRSNVQKSKCPKGQKSWDQKSEEQRSKRSCLEVHLYQRPNV